MTGLYPKLLEYGAHRYESGVSENKGDECIFFKDSWYLMGQRMTDNTVE